MTPDEAATILGIDKDADVSEILATYSKKVQLAGASSAASDDPEVQTLVEARTTLMDDRRRRAATDRQPAPAGAGQPQYGQRSATTQAAPAASAWGDDTAKGKRFTPEQEAIRKQRSMIIAVIGLVLSLTGWVWWLLEPLSLLGMGLSIWAMVRVRGFGTGLYTGTRVVAWIAVVTGALALIGNILLIVSALGAK